MGWGSPSGAPPMVETLSGISAGWLTELITMNSPRRSNLRLHGYLHRRLHRDLSFAVPFADQRLEVLHRRSPFPGLAFKDKTWAEVRTHRPGTARASAFAGAIGEASLRKVRAD